jgi:transcriptional regulator with XRE-family HTH domain
MIDSAWFNQKLIEKGVSASDLARFLGVDRSAVSRMLKGQRKMSAEEQDLIADYLGASLLEVAARRRGELTGFAESKQEEYVHGAARSNGRGALATAGRRDTTGGDAHSLPVHPAFGCMAGTMTIPDDLDLTAPIDVEWSDELYNE